MNISDIRNAYEENRQLKKKIAEFKGMDYDFQKLKEENEELRAELEITDSIRDYTPIQATVISRSPERWVEQVTINKGKHDGVHENMAVRTADGMVGEQREFERPPDARFVSAPARPSVALSCRKPRSHDDCGQSHSARRVYRRAGRNSCDRRVLYGGTLRRTAAGRATVVRHRVCRLRRSSILGSRACSGAWRWHCLRRRLDWTGCRSESGGSWFVGQRAGDVREESLVISKVSRLH